MTLPKGWKPDKAPNKTPMAYNSRIDGGRAEYSESTGRAEYRGKGTSGKSIAGWISLIIGLMGIIYFVYIMFFAPLKYVEVGNDQFLVYNDLIIPSAYGNSFEYEMFITTVLQKLKEVDKNTAYDAVSVLGFCREFGQNEGSIGWENCSNFRFNYEIGGLEIAVEKFRETLPDPNIDLSGNIKYLPPPFNEKQAIENFYNTGDASKQQ